MHILLIHQAFAGINEPGGTRHHEIAKYLAQEGHQVTVIASPVSYLTGKSSSAKWKMEEETGNPKISVYCELIPTKNCIVVSCIV